MLDYEIEGLENIPKDKPALIIFYHSPAAVDFFFATAKIFLKTGRKIKPIVERSMFNNPGLRSWFEGIEASPEALNRV